MDVFVPEFFGVAHVLFHQILVDNGAHEPHRLQKRDGVALFGELVDMTNVPIALNGLEHHGTAVPAVDFRVHRHQPRKPNVGIAFQIADDFGPLLCPDLIGIELRIRQHIEVLEKHVVIALAANTALVLDTEPLEIRECLLGKLAEHAFAGVALGARREPETAQPALECLAIRFERPLLFTDDSAGSVAHFGDFTRDFVAFGQVHGLNLDITFHNRFTQPLIVLVKNLFELGLLREEGFLVAFALPLLFGDLTQQ